MGVTGIGGSFFFRSKDPEALRTWYVEHLGVGSVPYVLWTPKQAPAYSRPLLPIWTILSRTANG